MADKLTITGIWRNDRTSSAGKAYVSVSIKTREHGDRYLSGFGSAWNADWKVGDSVEVDITKKPGTDKEGKPVEYLNFSKPDPLKEYGKAIMRHELEISKLWGAIKELQPRKLTPAELPEPPDDFDTVNNELAGREQDDTSLPL